jgi:uncharacterized integral membrane protein
MSEPTPSVNPEGELNPGVETSPVAGEVAEEPVAASAATAVDPSQTPPYTHTRASGFWAAVVVGLLVLLVLVIFILENGQRASVSFFGAHGHLPEGVALLLAAVIGGLFVVLAGAARILQLRKRAHGQMKKARGPTKRRRLRSNP